MVETLSNIVEENVCANRSTFVCQRCETKTKSVVKLSSLRKELKVGYEATKLKYAGALCGRDGETPEKIKSQKRPAVFSPGTPMSKPRPKKLINTKDVQDRNDRENMNPSLSTVTSRLVSPRFHSQVPRSEKIINSKDVLVRRNMSPSHLAVNSRIPIWSPKCQKQLKPRESASQHHTKAKVSLSFGPAEKDFVEIPQMHEISFHNEDSTNKRCLPEKWTCVAEAIRKGDEKTAIDHVLKMDMAKQPLQKLVLNEIKRETTDLCKPTSKSLFRDTSVEALMDFSAQKQMDELQEKAPLFLSVLQSASQGDRIQGNVIKTKERIIPKVVTAASVILNCKSQKMSAHQCANSMMLKNCGVKKSAVTRLNAKGLALSYSSTLTKQTEFGVDYDKTVKEWAKEVHNGNERERQLREDGDMEGLEKHNKTREDKSYQLNMDNADLVVHARHPTKNNYGRDYHMANMMAVQNRIDSYHLSSDHELPKLEDIDTEMFLPNATDNKKLKHEWAVLCGRIIKEHMPGLKTDLRDLPDRIPHEHMNEAKKKSTVINLGVIMENENTSEGIYNIMHHLHAYVPGHGTERPTTIISGGDLLTCERESTCIEEQRNSTTPSKRLEGLMPVIADFHALANYYQVMWKHLYDPASGADKGTLYAARNFLQARDVTVDPMRNVNAAEHLVTQYTTALILAAALFFFGMQNCEAEPTRNKFKLDVHGDKQTYSTSIMHEFVEQFVLPSNAETSLESSGFVCNTCNKKYASKKNLLKHQRDKGHRDTHATTEAMETDAIQNYSRVALGMGLLAMDFRDARQYGDGDRIMRLYKFLLLHCKVAKKPKYSFHILRLLAQVHIFLSPRLAYELVWNRFVNTSGRADGNVEVDRVMEHHNRIFKESAHGLRGKITQKNVDRVSRSAQKIDELTNHIDKEFPVSKSRTSSKHKVAGNDAVSLALELHKANIFGFQPGRAHHRFPQFPSSVFSALNAPEIHDWIKSTIKKWYRQNQFQTRY